MYPYYFSQEQGRFNSNYLVNYLGIKSHEEALEKGFVPLDVIPPSYDHLRQRVIDNGTIVENNSAKVDWVIEDLPREVIISNLTPIYLKQIDDYFDRVAQGKNYDNKVTCSLRAGFTGPYQQEGIAFAAWMDACYSALYAYLEELNTDTTKPLPNSIQDVIAILPTPPWSPKQNLGMI